AGMMRRSRLLPLLLCALLACTDDFDPNDPTRLSVLNGSGVVIEMVNFSACTEPDFDEDRLDPAEDIAPGASRDFEVEPGCYDMRVWFAGGESETELEIELAEGETFVWEVG